MLPQDRRRQILAALLSAVGFLLLHFGLSMVWWLALILVAAVYAAALLLIRRRRQPEDAHLSDRVTSADITVAAEALEDARVRLEKAASKAPMTDAGEIGTMAIHLGSIRHAILEHPEDQHPALRFVAFHLPDIVRTVETYVKLSAQTAGDGAIRLHDISGQIRNFGSVVERIDAASIENDLRALEFEIDGLSSQSDRVRR